MTNSTECMWLKCEREYFVDILSNKLDLDKAKLLKALKEYNVLLQKALLGENQYITDDLKIKIAKSLMGVEDSVNKREDRKSGRTGKQDKALSKKVS